MQRKSVHEELLEQERADRLRRVANWQLARLSDLATTLREVGRALCEEDENHPALEHIKAAADLLGKR